MTARSIVRSLLAAVRILPPRATTPDYLRRHVTRSWKKELRLLRQFGLADGMAILDLGSGPGHYAEAIRQAFPHAAITALDSNPAMLAGARRLAEVTLVEARADATGLPAGSFDFVIARLLFQHLSDPASTAHEAHRLLKNGGKLVIIDVDDDLFGVVNPEVPGLRRLMRRYGRAQADRGGNRRIGRALLRVLRSAGFTSCEIEAIAIHSDESGLEETFPQLDAAPLAALEAARAITPGEHEQFRRARDEFVSALDPYAMVLMFAACGVKSSALS